jgi:FKBP-type peptidyl-prolyl cis-trans isomerase
MKNIRALLLAALVLPLLAACAVGDATGTGSGRVEDTDFASSLGVDLAASTKTADGLYYRDISVGTGRAVVTGDSVNIYYSGYLSNGTLFQQNQTTGIGFKLGTAEVIQGLDEGIPGMHVGGTRQIIIPSALAYGAYGNDAIPGNAVIVFNIQVLSAF